MSVPIFLGPISTFLHSRVRHRLERLGAGGRPDADRFHVRGFIEQGTTATPFDMTVRNRAPRYHLVIDAIDKAKRTPVGSSELIAWCRAQLSRHASYVTVKLEECPRFDLGPGNAHRRGSLQAGAKH